MNQRDYDLLYGKGATFAPQSAREIAEHYRAEEETRKRSEAYIKQVSLQADLDEKEEAEEKELQKRLLQDATESGLDLGAPVALDLRSGWKAYSDGMERHAFTNTSNFRNSHIQNMRSAGHGGFILGATSGEMRSRYAGSDQVARTMASVLPEEYADFKNILTSVRDVGQASYEGDWASGNGVWDLWHRASRGMGNVVDFYSDYYHGVDTTNYGHHLPGPEMDKAIAEGQFIGAPDEPGTPLYSMMQVVDPTWTTAKKVNAVIQYFFHSKNAAVMKQLGITQEDFMETKSFGHLSTMLSQRFTEYEAGQYAGNASGLALTTAFVSNLGATIATDAETIAEIALTGGLMIPAKAASTTALVGRKILVGGARAHRAANKAATAARVKGTSDVAVRSSMVGRRRIRYGALLQSAGEAGQKATSVVTVFNPFTVGERIVAPAIRDVRMLRKAAEKGAKGSGLRNRNADLRKAINSNKLGVTGVVLRNTMFNQSDVSMVGTLAAAMLDGGGQNFLAYATTRDEEFAFAQAIYGDKADAAGIAFQWSRGESFMDMMNSGAGAFAMGFGFGAVMGVGTRALGLSAFDPDGSITGIKPSVEEGVITRNPVAKIKNFASNLKARAKARADMFADTSASFAASVAEGGKNSALLASLHLKGIMAKAGTLTPEAEATLDAIVMSAHLAGVNAQRLAKRVGRKGKVNFRMLKRMINEEIKTPGARARRLGMRGRRVPIEVKMAAMAFNSARIETAIEKGADFGEGGHRNALDQLIIDTPEGPLRTSLVEFRKNVDLFTEDVLDLISENIGDWGDWKALDKTTQQRILNDSLESSGLEGKLFNVEELNAAIDRVTPEQIAEAKAREAEIAEKRRVAAAEAEKRDAPEPEAKEDLSKLTVKALRKKAAEAKIPGRSKMNKADLIAALGAKREAPAPKWEGPPEQPEVAATPRSDEKVAQDIAVREVLSERIGESQLEDAVSAYDHLAIAEGNPARIQEIDENITIAALRHTMELQRSEDADARSRNIVPEWNMKILATKARERADRVRAVVDRKAEDKVAADKVAKLKTKQAVQDLIYREFGVMINLDGEGVAKGTSIDAAGVRQLYVDLHALRSIENLDPSLRSKFESDPLISVAIGEPGAQAALARSIVEGIEALAVRPRTTEDGRVTMAELIQALPPGFEGLAHTAFGRSESRHNNNSTFDLEDLRMEAAKRLAFADENFRKEFLANAKKRKEALSGKEVEIIERLEAFDNQAAQTRAFLERRTAANMGTPGGPRHTRRIQRRLKEGQTLKDYIAQEDRDVIRGVIDGWKALKDGPAKDALARKLGIADLARKDELFGTDDTPELRALRESFAARLWKAAHEASGLPITPARALIDGTIDSSRGYHVGRALTEAVSGTVPENRAKTGSIADSREALPRAGFLGRMSNEGFIKMYQKHTRESVIDYVLGLGTATDANGLRYLSGDDIEEILLDLEAISSAAKGGGMTEDMLARLNRVGYDSAERLRMVPAQTLKNLNKKLDSVRKFIEDQVAFVMDTPPGVINMLHDEASVNATGFDTTVILGNAGETRALNPDVSGDGGLSSGVVTPGSWKDVWNLRNEGLFGTVAGFSKMAANAGMKNLAAEIASMDEADLLQQLAKMRDVHNAEDASAQAVTMAQAIARDMGEGSASQENFQRALSGVAELLGKHGGAQALARKVEEEAAKYAEFLTNPNAIDKYSDVGLAFMRRMEDGGWRDLLEEYVEIDTEGVTSFKQGADPKVSAALRNFFKPPVMTIVYGAGAPAFRRNAIQGLVDIVNALPPEKQEAFRKLAGGMVDEWMNAIDNDIIAEVLNIPTARELVQAVRSRNLTGKTDSGTELFTIDGERYTIGDIASGEWLTAKHESDTRDSRGQKVYENLANVSEEVFGVRSAELGLWYAKLVANNDGKRLKRAVKNMRSKIANATNARGELDLDQLNREFEPVNTYMSSVDSANRLGFLPEENAIDRQLKALGVAREDLDPMVLRALLHKAALYQNTGPAAGRKFGFFDGPTIVRNQNPETTVGEITKSNSTTQIGQVTLADAHRNMAGLSSEVDLEARVRSAVMQQFLIEMGSIIAPPKVGDAPEFRYPSMDEFYDEIYDMEARNPAGIRQAKEEENSARLAELRAKKNLTPEEDDELGLLEALHSSAYRVDDDGKSRTTSGSSLLASQIRAKAHFNMHSEVEQPTTLGVAHMQQLAHRMNDADMRLENADRSIIKGLESNAQAFTADEVTTPSPLHPEWIDKARTAAPMEAPAIDDASLAAGMGKRSEASIEAEKKMEKAAAQADGLNVTGRRVKRLINRIGEQTDRAIAHAKYKHRKNPAQLEKALAGIRARAKQRIIRGIKNTTGFDVDARDSSVNSFRINNKGVRLKGGGGETLLEALQRMIFDNNMSNLTGLALGPSERLGIDLRKEGQTQNVMPFSAARSPMTVFAMDWYLMGGASRDYVAMTVFRIAQARAGKVDDAAFTAIVRDMNERGFRVVLEEFITDKYGGLQTADDLEAYFRDSEEAKGQLDDRYAVGFVEEIETLGSKIDAEFGAELPPLPMRMSTDEKMRFIGIKNYLEDGEAGKARMDFIRENTGLKDLTPDDVAIAYSMNPTQLRAAAQANDASVPFIPRETVNAKGEAVVVTNEVDRINSREMTDENVAPGTMPLFSYDQILHLLNMPSNRNLVAQMILHQLTGININTSRRLDAQVKDTVDAYAAGDEAHGFASAPRSVEEAEQLVVPESSNPMASVGQAANKEYGINVTGEDVPLLGVAYTAYRSGLMDGELNDEAASLLNRLGYLNDDDVATITNYVHLLKRKDAEAEARLEADNALARADANLEEVTMEGDRVVYQDADGVEQEEVIMDEASPFRDEYDGDDDGLAETPVVDDTDNRYAAATDEPPAELQDRVADINAAVGGAAPVKYMDLGADGPGGKFTFINGEPVIIMNTAKMGPDEDAADVIFRAAHEAGHAADYASDNLAFTREGQEEIDGYGRVKLEDFAHNHAAAYMASNNIALGPKTRAFADQHPRLREILNARGLIPSRPEPAAPKVEQRGTEIEVNAEGRTNHGERFRNLLKKLGDDGSLAARNAAGLFEMVTGRVKGDGPKVRMSDTEAMIFMEMVYIDNDLADSIFGHTDIMYTAEGSAGVSMLDSSNSTETTPRLNFFGLDEVIGRMKSGRVDAAVYLTLHELGEGLDLKHSLSSRNLDNNDAARNSTNSQMRTHFLTNFGTPKAREKWVMMMKELGLYDARMKAFISDVEKMFKNNPEFRAEAIDDQMYSARKAMSDRQDPGQMNLEATSTNYRGEPELSLTEESRLRLEEAQEVSRLVTEGYVQALTMAMFSKRSDQFVAKHGNPTSGLSSVAELLNHKMTRMLDFIGSHTLGIKRGASIDDISGTQLREGKYRDDLINQIKAMKANIDKHNVHYHEGDSAGRMTRYFGGRGEAPAPRVREKIAADIKDLESRMIHAPRHRRAAMAIEIDKLRDELGLAMIDPKAVEADAAKKRELGNKAKDTRGLIDTRKLHIESERIAVENQAVDDLLNGLDVARSGGIGRVFNFFAGRFVAAKGSFTGNNSRFSQVRAVTQLINPEMVNGKINGEAWIPDQMAMSYNGRDLTLAVNNLKGFRKRVKKLKDEELRRYTMEFDRMLRVRDPDVRARIQQEMDMSPKEIAEAESFHKHMFDPDSGFIDRLARNLVETGVLTQGQHTAFRDMPGLPMQFMKGAIEGESVKQTIRKALKERGAPHLLQLAESKGMMEVEILDAQGLLMQRTASDMTMRADFDNLAPELQAMYKSLADDMEMAFRMAEADTEMPKGPEFLRAYLASEFLKNEMKRPKEARSPVSGGYVRHNALMSEYIKYLKNADAAPTRYSFGPDGELSTKTRAQLLYDNTNTLDPFEPQDGLDLLAQREFVDLKTGGKLGPSRLVGNRADLASDEALYPYLDFDTSNQLNSLIGSNAIMSMGTTVQQQAIGIKGGNTLFVIDNLLKRTQEPGLRDDNGKMLTGIELMEMRTELQELRNQLRAGYNMRPDNVEADTEFGRGLRALSRIGVSLVSAGNFALSAIVEVLAGLPRTMGKVMHGDLRAIGDYFTMLNPESRAKVMEQADGFEMAKMHLGVHTRFGDMGYDDIEALSGRMETGPLFSLDGLERMSRKLSSMAMYGFGGITEYARAVSVSQAIRSTKRMAANKHGGYARLAAELAKLPADADNKTIRGVARKYGMDGQEAVQLRQSGMMDPAHMQRVNQLLTDDEYYNNTGLNLDKVYATGAYTQYEIATVKTILQFQNNKINLDPRMGNKQIPQNIFEQLISVLGQFPVLFYTRMRQSAYQGGGMAVAGFLFTMLLGEMYYTNLAQLARGEDPEKLFEKMTSSDPSWILSTLENMNVMGGASPVLSGIVGSAVTSLREVTDNPDLLGNYAVGISRNPVGIAGLSMLKSGMINQGQGVAALYAGDTSRGLAKLAGGTPVPMKQAVKMLLHNGIDQTAEGQMMAAELLSRSGSSSRGSRRGSERSSGSRGAATRQGTGGSQRGSLGSSRLGGSDLADRME